MASQSSLYRFYLLRADGHIAGRRDGYFDDDAAAIAAVPEAIAEHPSVEIWCEGRKVIALSREALARASRASPLIRRPAIFWTRHKPGSGPPGDQALRSHGAD